MHPLRLALFLALMFPLLVVLAYYAGFEASISWQQLVLSACVAYAAAFVAAGVGLALLGVLQPGMSIEDIVGKISLQAIIASIGAMLARSQLGQQDEEQREEDGRRDTDGGELFLATVGALFLAFNVAPTEEIVLIATMVTGWQALALVAVSLAIMHAFVYAVEFRGQAARAPRDRRMERVSARHRGGVRAGASGLPVRALELRPQRRARVRRNADADRGPGLSGGGRRRRGAPHPMRPEARATRDRSEPDREIRGGAGAGNRSRGAAIPLLEWIVGGLGVRAGRRRDRVLVYHASDARPNPTCMFKSGRGARARAGERLPRAVSRV